MVGCNRSCFWGTLSLLKRKAPVNASVASNHQLPCREGFDKWGYDRLGFDHKGYDKFGFDKNGYDK